MSEPLLLGPKTLADVNRARVVMTLCEHGPLPRSELARISGVTRTTIGTHVDALVAERTLEELPVPANGGKGRPARPVWFRRDAGLCGGLVIQAGVISAGVVNARGEVLDYAERAVASRTSPEQLAATAAELFQDVRARRRRLLGVGVAIAGAVDFEGQRVLRAARQPGIEGTRFIGALREAIGHRLVIDNDARAGAMAERWYGRGRSQPTFWTVQIGFGIGGAAVIDGVLYRGRAGAAGELGHTSVHAGDLVCVCGRVGCWETVAALDWLRGRAEALGIRDASTLTLAALGAQAEGGDATAQQLTDEYAENVALGLTNLIRTMSPETIILQGEIVTGGQHLLDRIREHLNDQALQHLSDATDVQFSELGVNARLLGAGALVLADAWAVRP